MDIPFTQFLRPDGRRREIFIERPDEICEKAMDIIKAGYRLEIEELKTGHINMTISDDEDDYEREIVNNGPGVPLAVDKMVNRFYGRLYQNRRDQ